jgi:hypothetical protein
MSAKRFFIVAFAGNKHRNALWPFKAIIKQGAVPEFRKVVGYRDLLIRGASHYYEDEERLYYEDLSFLTAVSMKNCVFWDVTPCGSNRSL